MEVKIKDFLSGDQRVFIRTAWHKASLFLPLQVKMETQSQLTNLKVRTDTGCKGGEALPLTSSSVCWLAVDMWRAVSMSSGDDASRLGALNIALM